MDSSSVAYTFGAFRLDPDRRLLERAGVPVSVSSRGYDILSFLVASRDRVVSRDELTAVVWPDTAVDPSNLTVQMSALRRALGDVGGEPRLIATIPGRGYQFVGQVDGDAAASQAFTREAPASMANTIGPVAEPNTRAGLSRYIAAAALLGLCAVLAVNWSVQPRRPLLSIAVMPFENLGSDDTRKYLTEAVTYDLTTEVDHIPGSAVPARRSVDAISAGRLTPREIGRRLNVRYLVEGSVRAVGADLHVNAQLVDASSGQALWADGFNLTCACKLLEIDSQIVDRIASALGPELVRLASQRSMIERPSDPEAIDLFLRARSILNSDPSPKGWAEADHLLEAAVSKAPRFPEALAELGEVLVAMIDGTDDPHYVLDHQRAQAAVDQALAIAPSYPGALLAKASLLEVERNCAGASAFYDAALLIEPNNVEAREEKAQCAITIGKPEDAVAEIRETLRIDPLNPQAQWRYKVLAEATLLLGRYRESIEWLRRAGMTGLDPQRSYESLGPDEFPALFLIADMALDGDNQRAAALYANYARIWPHRTIWRMTAYFDKGTASGPGFEAFRKGLLQAGMPAYADENGSATHTMGEAENGDFAPTPLRIDGGTRVSTKDVLQILNHDASAVVVDVGRGAAVMKHAFWQSPQLLSESPDAFVEASASQNAGSERSRRIIVVGDGPFGASSYHAAAHLISLQYTRVLWYRGGEEAWAKAQLPAEDRRLQ